MQDDFELIFDDGDVLPLTEEGHVLDHSTMLIWEEPSIYLEQQSDLDGVSSDFSIYSPGNSSPLPFASSPVTSNQQDDAGNTTSDEGSEADEIEEAAPTTLKCIEDMVVSFLSQLAGVDSNSSQSQGSTSEEEPQSSGNRKTKPTQKSKKITLQLVDRQRLKKVDGSFGTKCMVYPKRMSSGSSKPFAQLFRVLDLAHEATMSGIPTTKRDIYYKDVALFKTQKVVDTLVDDLAATFEMERSDLNIRSSSKGLVCGSGLSITLISGEIIRGNDSEATLIPAGEDILSFSVEEGLSWVLVVEKEAVFQTLCKLRLTDGRRIGSGILITGKGYPDIATRHLVKSLSDALPKTIPIVGLMDADPYGLDILSVYKYGSRSMQHENEKLAARRIRWLGVWSSDFERFGIDRDCLLPITKHDERKARAMLLRQDISLPKRWRKELQYMLHNRRKAEIEVMSSRVLTEEDDINFQLELGGGEVFSGEMPKQDMVEIIAAGWEDKGVVGRAHMLLLRYLEKKISSLFLV